MESERLKCKGYIYKWGVGVGGSEYTIPEDVFKKGAPEDRIYPVTDGTFRFDDIQSVLGHAKVSFDPEGVMADITIVSEAAKKALEAESTLSIEERKLKLGFYINNVKKNEKEKTIVAGSLRAIDIAECGMHPIEYIGFYGKENEDAGSVQSLPKSEPAV